ncbi:MAG: N-acetylglucosamine-6-phosphate deacetylase [Ruminococcaceae bacterium]|nr:N-acetylglucosamine-6-phosphate deacetylase [Oscillospiraceae bacterium]
MKKCIANGKILLKDKIIENYVIIFSEKIEKILPVDKVNLSEYEVIDAKENFVSPGFIDMHIHGYLGKDVSDGDADGIKIMAEGIAKNGVTSWCPTTMTVSKKEIENAFDAVRKVKNSSEYYGAKILGVNSEGPFINSKKKGAQAEEHILKPDADFIIENSDVVKLFTVAPEVDGALECIEKVNKNTNVLISMGHTDATFEEAQKGINSGAKHTTHLFNAMTALTHRSPGVVGAALSDENVSVELIADTFHVNKGIFGLIAKIKEDKLCLITDCIRAGGMPDGDYTLGGQPVHKEGIKCLMPDGTIAGSVLKLNEAVLNIYENTEVKIYEAVNLASLNPAIALKIDDRVGSIAEGKTADLVVFDEKISVLMTIIDGQIRYKGEKI